MVLTRLGNKRRIAAKILPFFPAHDLYIEPFFGAGGMFFIKPRAKYNIVNDYDSDVFNLFRVLSDQRDQLKEGVYDFPVHDDLWNYWKAHRETEPVMRAVRFLFLSNFGFMGKPNTLRLNTKNTKKLLYERIDETARMLFGVDFANRDFRDFLASIPLSDGDRKKTLIYADPPYLETANNYESGFKPDDFKDLISILMEMEVQFCVSEFDHPIVLETAKTSGLRVEHVIERKALKSLRNEIILLNY